MLQVVHDNDGCSELPDWDMAMHWIDRYAAGIDCECQLDRIAHALGIKPPNAEVTGRGPGADA